MGEALFLVRSCACCVNLYIGAYDVHMYGLMYVCFCTYVRNEEGCMPLDMVLVRITIFKVCYVCRYMYVFALACWCCMYVAFDVIIGLKNARMLRTTVVGLYSWMQFMEASKIRASLLHPPRVQIAKSRPLTPKTLS